MSKEAKQMTKDNDPVLIYKYYYYNYSNVMHTLH